MRSSIGVTKVLAFYFILLHLFLKAKMCVGAIHGASSGNINDSDESFFPVETHTTVAPLLDSIPSPVGHSVAKIHRRQHAAVVSTPKPTAALHHVRHEHSFVKNRHIVHPQDDHHLRSHKSNFKSAQAAGRNWYPNQRRPPHHHRGLHQRDFNPTSSSSSFALSSPHSVHRARLNRANSRSISTNQQKSNPNPRLENQPKPLSAFTTEPIKSSTKKHKSSGDSKKSTHHTNNYFEELLNSYKSNSPYYKDHLKRDSSVLTKSLQALNTKCSDKKCKSRHAKEDTNDDDYDYEYEEEDDDEDDYDDEYYDTEAQGDAGYSTTTNSVTVADSTKLIQEQDYSNVNNKFDNSLHQDNDDAVEAKHSLSNSVDTTRENNKVLSKEVYAADANMAKFHVAKLRREGNCNVPKPKIVLASNDPTKQYTPHCTILHRCGDDVGCCPQAKTCAASKNSTVELYFFVKAVGSRSTIERLSFINHTECACINRHESINRRTPSVSIVATPTKPPICNCPTYFQRVVDNDNRCFCDCSSSDSQCDQFKRGLEHFSMDNRRCIMNNRCEEPRCEYGRYNIAKGKCPAKKDALSIAFKV
ncbi:uncharacterized protein LOC120429075 [Culex pipiens pallens]|uniref:uncharacterized protein LOC120429075 n=1 Tax=Culex pipiens pallens TaxID=42434 RepID=UPI001953ACC9|nr:uncharacterized protein LOC120429075 [Culex pipiens pallens]